MDPGTSVSGLVGGAIVFLLSAGVGLILRKAAAGSR